MGSDAGAETGPYAVVTANTGSRAALAEQLFTANYPKLAGWVRRLVDDEETAHEIASEAFVRLLSKWTSPDKLDNPQSYLFMIATNLVRDHWRKAERERRAMRNITAGSDPEPSVNPAQDVDVRELIAALPAKLRDPFLLHYYAGFGIKEIAALVKRPEGTVKADLYHARASSRMLSPNARAAGRTAGRATDDGRAGGTMDADDERDPLDRWLSQQAPPLPPPPGTFELITRRARRRKLRKLAVTMVSAAAVAAAVAIAVPVGLNLHLTSPSAREANVADGGGSTRPGNPVADRSGSPVKTSSPSPSATHSAIAPSGQAHPVPRNFQPTSVTFVSSQAALGDRRRPAPPARATTRTPTSARRSREPMTAGRAGRAARRRTPAGPSGATGVSAIRFLNDTYGWAFGPELWATSDGGTTWSQVTTSGARVTDLETSGGRAYALWANGCPAPSGGSAAAFAAGCTSYTLMTATAGSADWRRVGQATNGLTNGGAPTSAVLALTGSDGYLLAPDGTLYSGSIGGTWSQVGPSPCKPGAAQADGLPSAAQLALVNSSQLCDRLQRDVGGLTARAVHVR